MNVLVTGGTGFTGAALVSRLATEGHMVTALDSKEGLRTPELKSMGAQVALGSVTDPDVIARYMKGVEIVFHLAAAFRELNVSQHHYWEVNVEGTRNVIEAAFRANVRKFVYCSTCGVHGNINSPPAAEDAPILPADYYQRTKFEAEPIVQDFSERGLKTVILRPAAIYGPGDPERFFMIFKRVARGSFPMFGHGKTYYHPLYIDNLIDSFLLLMEEDKGKGETYLIADRHYLTIEELVKKVARALDVDVKLRYYPLTPLVVAGYICEAVCKPFRIKPPIFPRRVDWYRQHRAFDIQKAERELGYRPKVDIDNGLKRTAEWYKSEGFL